MGFRSPLVLSFVETESEILRIVWSAHFCFRDIDLYTEFKSTLLDRRYKRIKIKMLESIAEIEPTIIYSVYQKKVSKMNQVQKEAVYITLLTSILTHLKNETTVIFDRFGKTDFENNIMSLTKTIPNVVSIYPEDSQRQHGLQFADNICSVLPGIQDRHIQYADINAFFFRENPPLILNFFVVSAQTINAEYIQQIVLFQDINHSFVLRSVE